ncbi:MAG: hypothetical protein DHS20C18_49850 [Saprospiraceae bacterium]|nr:MAG: hypothetical protein DHS20C18_49850 [Saprospiraceae bacterium]
MAEASIIGSVLGFFIVVVSYKGFKDTYFFEQYLFDVDKILIEGEYKRMVTSGFLHGGLWHLIFNLIALLSFSGEVEFLLGPFQYIVIYFGSLVGGNLLALYLHRNHGDYRAVGASGAVSGIVFSFVVMSPNSSISFIFLPIEITSWVFALLFVAVSVIGIKFQRDNIGHEAHLGGAIIGVLITIGLKFSVLRDHPWVVAAILIPSILFLGLIVRNPAILMVEKYWGETVDNIKLGIKKKPDRISPEEELDVLLEKIRKNGLKSLSDKERKRLDELSNYRR